jgi:hypothetical protein
MSNVNFLIPLFSFLVEPSIWLASEGGIPVGLGTRVVVDTKVLELPGGLSKAGFGEPVDKAGVLCNGRVIGRGVVIVGISWRGVVTVGIS